MVRRNDYSLEHHSPAFPVPPVGTQVTVNGDVFVMAEHEVEGFGFPDVREDWTIRAILLERWDATDPREHRSTTAVNALDCRDVVGPGVSYLLDLELVQPGVGPRWP